MHVIATSRRPLDRGNVIRTTAAINFGRIIVLAMMGSVIVIAVGMKFI